MSGIGSICQSAEVAVFFFSGSGLLPIITLLRLPSPSFQCIMAMNCCFCASSLVGCFSMGLVTIFLLKDFTTCRISSGRYDRAFFFIHSGMIQMASAMLPTMAPRVSASAPRLTARRMASSKLWLWLIIQKATGTVPSQVSSKRFCTLHHSMSTGRPKCRIARSNPFVFTWSALL